MVDNCCIRLEEEEEDQFFDSREELSSLSSFSSCDERDFVNWTSEDHQYKVWLSDPVSIQERRAKLRRWMGLDPIQSPCPKCSDPITERITSDDGGAVLMSSMSSMGSGMESCSSTPSLYFEGCLEESFEFRIKNLDDGLVFVVEELGEDGSLRSLREVNSDRVVTLGEFDRDFGPYSFLQNLMQKEEEEDNKSFSRKTTAIRIRKNRLLKKLGAATCILYRKCEETDLDIPDSDKRLGSTTQRIRVRSNKKRLKEVAAIYMGQDIKAHKGAISTMKFSPDGEYLASGGQDGVVRVWRVMERERRDEIDIPEDDPSCIFFKVNDNMEVAPLYLNKEKLKMKHIKRTSDLACVVIPPVVLCVSEEPVHEFYGHDGDVLDLSWSKDKYLLSSSIDKSVRLWKVGSGRCLAVFAHNNYVTCIQFNPVNENYFVSGSIDGKVRIWEVQKRHVVDWIDIRDIVTALTYSLDGKGIVVGTMTGDCRFYNASDNKLKLGTLISLQSKKKSHEKRITGFQYCPTDHEKLMVTTGDSQIRILDGVDVVSKYKGFRNSGSQISASFMSDGKHIISASEDSRVYIWTHTNRDSPKPNRVKSIRTSECFYSYNVLIAIPWHGPTSRNLLPNFPQENCSDSSEKNSGYFFSESLPKTSATWPEENLPFSSSTPLRKPVLRKSDYKFLKFSYKNSSHMWGQAIVTAGLDGRIRTYRNYGLPLNQ